MPDTAHSTKSSLEHVYQAAEFLSRNGDYDLAIALLRKALIAARVEHEVGRTVDVDADAQLGDVEKRIEAQYAAFRLRYEDSRKPWVQTLARTAVIAVVVAVTFIVCVAFAVYRLEALIASPVTQVTSVLDAAVKSELPRITGRVLEVVPEVSAQVNKEMQNVSVRFSSYLEKRIDTALDERIAAIVDEKLKAREQPKP